MKINHWHQPEDNYCIPTCQKMVLDYMVQAHNIKNCKPLSISTLAKVTKTRVIDGTIPKDAEKVNTVLHRTKPPIKFKLLEGQKFGEVSKELKDERPVITIINLAELPRTVWHAVVVSNFDPETNLITYHDPEDTEAESPRNMEVGVFMQKWGWQARMIKVLLGTGGQTYIDGDWKDKDEDMV
jgi:hypothetical protein